MTQVVPMKTHVSGHFKWFQSLCECQYRYWTIVSVCLALHDFSDSQYLMLYTPCVLLCTSDSPSVDLDQLELPVLCDGLRRYLQDLPQPIIPTAIYAQMVLTAKGERMITCLFVVHLAWNTHAHCYWTLSPLNTRPHEHRLPSDHIHCLCSFLS